MDDLNIYFRRLMALPHVSNFLSWIFFGLLVGVAAKLILPGQESLGWIRTILVGICGAFLGGFLAAYLGYNVHVGWNMLGFVAAVGGSVVLLLINRLVTKT